MGGDDHPTRDPDDRGEQVSSTTGAPTRLRAHGAAVAPTSLDAIASRWREIEDHAQPNPFLTFDWMDAWWRTFGAEHEPYVILGEDDDGTAVGIVPLMRSVVGARFGGRVATLRFIGDRGSDRLGVLSRRGREHEVAAAAAAHLRRHHHDWHVLDCANLVTGSPDLGALMEAFSGGHLVIAQPGLSCPFMTIQGDWESYLQGRSANFRTKLRRSRRRIDHELGARLTTCSTLDEVRRALEFLFAHNIERFEGGAVSAFADPRVQAFHLAVAPSLLDRGRLSLLVLDTDGGPAAVLYCFLHGDVVWTYNAAFDSRRGAYGLGSSILGYAVEHAFERGAREVDFLLGDHPY